MSVVPKVSVHIITYNQANFIAQAVNSVLSQQVNFDYEIVIGDDCSTDSTRDILLEFQRANPDRIRLLLRDQKLPGLPGKQNFLETLSACRGKYVALLDGDDYWIHPRKLQTQVDFMESNPTYSICFHNAKVTFENSSRPPEDFNPPDQKPDSTLEDLFARNFMATASVLFRRGLFGEIPEWYYEIMSGDWALHMLNARHGKIHYVDQVMSVYRIHGSSWWASHTPIQQQLGIIRTLHCIDAHFNREYRTIVNDVKAERYSTIAEYCRLQRQYFAANRFLICALRYAKRSRRIALVNEQILHYSLFRSMQRSVIWLQCKLSLRSRVRRLLGMFRPNRSID
jgi:glycosyltransferase involved in cell wall biosynthesis